MKTLAERLKEERELAGMSQIELAKKAGLKHQSYISNLETGYHKSTGHLPEIAAALKLNVMWLKHGKGPKHLDQSGLQDGIYVADPEIAAIARILQDARQSGDDYLVEITRKDLDAHAELIAKAEARGRAKDC